MAEAEGSLNTKSSLRSRIRHTWAKMAEAEGSLNTKSSLRTGIRHTWWAWRKPPKQRRLMVRAGDDLEINHIFGPYSKKAQTDNNKWMPSVKRTFTKEDANLYGTFVDGQIYFTVNRRIGKKEEFCVWMEDENCKNLFPLNVSNSKEINAMVDRFSFVNLRNTIQSRAFDLKHNKKLKSLPDFGQFTTQDQENKSTDPDVIISEIITNSDKNKENTINEDECNQTTTNSHKNKQNTKSDEIPNQIATRSKLKKLNQEILSENTKKEEKSQSKEKSNQISKRTRQQQLEMFNEDDIRTDQQQPKEIPTKTKKIEPLRTIAPKIQEDNVSFTTFYVLVPNNVPNNVLNNVQNPILKELLTRQTREIGKHGNLNGEEPFFLHDHNYARKYSIFKTKNGRFESKRVTESCEAEKGEEINNKVELKEIYVEICYEALTNGDGFDGVTNTVSELVGDAGKYPINDDLSSFDEPNQPVADQNVATLTPVSPEVAEKKNFNIINHKKWIMNKWQMETENKSFSVKEELPNLCLHETNTISLPRDERIDDPDAKEELPNLCLHETNTISLPSDERIDDPDVKSVIDDLLDATLFEEIMEKHINDAANEENEENDVKNELVEPICDETKPNIVPKPKITKNNKNSGSHSKNGKFGENNSPEITKPNKIIRKRKLSQKDIPDLKFDEKNEIITDDEKITLFKCSHCGKQYRFEDSLKFHKCKKKPECLNTDSIQDSVPFKCADCGRKYKFEGSLKFHKCEKKKIVDSYQEATFKCFNCGKTYQFEDSLMFHKCEKKRSVDVCEERKDFKCLQCTKTFRFKDSLKFHQCKKRKCEIFVNN